MSPEEGEAFSKRMMYLSRERPSAATEPFIEGHTGGVVVTDKSICKEFLPAAIVARPCDVWNHGRCDSVFFVAMGVAVGTRGTSILFLSQWMLLRGTSDEPARRWEEWISDCDHQRL